MGPEKYVILYLIYGLAFVTLGISALQHSNKHESNFKLVNNIKYLGYFGLTHGLTELITMLALTGLYNEYYNFMSLFNLVLKAFSFLFLFIFGTKILNTKYKKYMYVYIIATFIMWFTIFVLVGLKHGFIEHLVQPVYNIIFLRYLMALPAGIITFLALLTDTKAIQRTKIYRIGYKYRALAIAFLVYGILDGLIVQSSNFFPANTINNDTFRNVFGLPVQVVKTLAGVSINLLFLQIIYVFNWERDEKLNELIMSKIISEERRKLGREIHDNTIQTLYGAGLKLELLIKKSKLDSEKDSLKEIKKTVNESIDSIRSFMVKDTDKTIDVYEFKENIEVLLSKFRKMSNTQTTITYQIPDFNLGKLTTETATQIYYIIQEALSNILKHSQADNVDIRLTSNINHLHVSIKDDGKGFNPADASEESFGLKSMRQRSDSINSKIIFNSEVGNGTKIILTVPWGE